MTVGNGTKDLEAFSRLLSADAILFDAARRLSQLGLPVVGEVIELAREIVAARLARLQRRVYALYEAKRLNSVHS